MIRSERKKILPSKCFFKTTRMGVPYKYCLTNDKDYAKYNRLTLKKNQDRLVKAEKILDKQEDTVKDLKAEIRKNKSKLAQDKRNKDNKKEEDKKITKRLGVEILDKIKSKLKSKSMTEIKTMDIKEARTQDKLLRQEIKALRKIKTADDEEKNKVKSKIKDLKEKQKNLKKYLNDSDTD